MPKPEFKLTELVLVAKELNELLDPKPKIKTVAVKVDSLVDAIKKAAELLEDSDTLTEATHGVLVDMEVELPDGIVVEGAEDEPEEPGVDETENETSEETPEDDEPEEKNEITLEDLVFLAKEMNDIMKLAPAIDVKEDDFDSLKESVLENCYEGEECQIYDTDEFSDDSWGTLKALGIEAVSETPVTSAPAAKDKEKDKTGKKKAEKSGEKTKEEKPAKETTAKSEKPANAAKKEGDAWTRSHALIEALKAGPGTREEIVALSDKLFVEKGGKTNPNVANYMFGYVLPSLKIIGTVSQEGKIFTWK